MAFRQKMQAVTRHLQFLWQSWCEGQFFSYLQTTARYLMKGVRGALFLLRKEREQVDFIDCLPMKKLRQVTQGLHGLIGKDNAFSYAIFLPWTDPTEKELQISLDAAFSQTAPHLQIWVAKPQRCSFQVSSIFASYKYLGLHLFQVDDEWGIGAQVNAWAASVDEKFLLVLFPGCWLRTDCLFRIEQSLRFCPPEERADLVLFFDEAFLSKKGHFIHGKRRRHSTLFPPYFFQDLQLGICVFSRELLLRAGGAPDVKKNIFFSALLLQLDGAGATCRHIPFPLFGRPEEKEAPPGEFLSILQQYTSKKKLFWEWSPGILAGTFRANPPLQDNLVVHAIVPFREQKVLTCKTVESNKRQKGIRPLLTAIDNASQDLSIRQEIERLGGEVLLSHEPFNYSRLNNFGVRESRYREEADWILFLNNDVELEESAVEEMCRWITQPQIGAVGCHLSYPNGTLQHGGVHTHSFVVSEYVGWHHREAHLPLESQVQARTLGVVPAVTAACLLVRRSLFLEVGGFDEVWYPIAFSDTHFCQKLQRRGWFIFYTPYARGIHHESVSRQVSLEDVEGSLWLQHQTHLLNRPKFSSDVLYT